MAETHVLLSELAIGESPRWHEERLWFAHWGTGEIVAVDLDGDSEVVAQGRPGLGWSIDWLPDGRLLVTGEELTRQEPDGSTVRHADLSAIDDSGWNEIVVDGRGNVCVNSVGFRFGVEEFRPAAIALITPDGSVSRVSEGIAFANGMVVTPDSSTLVVVESFAGTLTAFDIGADDGAFWPCPDENGPDTPRLFLDSFPTDDGRARFHAVRHRDAGETPDDEFPLYLTTGRILRHYQSGTQTRRVEALRAEAPEPFVELHPTLGHDLDVEDGELVWLESRRGRARARARLTPNIRPDTVFMPFHWGDTGAANQLTNPVLDPTSRMPEFKVCAVRLERDESSGSAIA
jgi:formylmethanofuran dehydrogenase subunit D